MTQDTEQTVLMPISARTASFYRCLLAIAVVNIALFTPWYVGLAPNIAAEDGILEMLQLLVAAGALCVFAFAALEDDGPIGTAGMANAAVCAIAVMREIDVRKIIVPDWMMIWSNSPFRDSAVVVLLLLVFAYLWVRRKHFRGWVDLLLRKPAWPYWLGGALLISSLAFDGDKIIVGPIGVLVEEFIELNGFMLLLVAAWRHCRLLTVGGQREF